MQNDAIPTYEQITALAGRVCRGEALTAEQRERLAAVLTSVGISMRVLAKECAPDGRVHRLETCWEPVGDAYIELLEAVSR